MCLIHAVLIRYKGLLLLTSTELMLNLLFLCQIVSLLGHKLPTGFVLSKFLYILSTICSEREVVKRNMKDVDLLYALMNL